MGITYHAESTTYRHLQALGRRRLIRVLVLLWQRYANGHQCVLQRNRYKGTHHAGRGCETTTTIVSRLRPGTPGNVSTTPKLGNELDRVALKGTSHTPPAT